jgi:hypothetical protein
MALFTTLGLISRPSAKMLSLAQHADYAPFLLFNQQQCFIYSTASFESKEGRKTA